MRVVTLKSSIVPLQADRSAVSFSKTSKLQKLIKEKSNQLPLPPPPFSLVYHPVIFHEFTVRLPEDSLWAPHRWEEHRWVFFLFLLWFWGGWLCRKVCEAAVGSCFSCQVRAGGGMDHGRVMKSTTGYQRKVCGLVLDPESGLQTIKLQNCIHISATYNHTTGWYWRCRPHLEHPWFSKVVLHVWLEWVRQVVLDRKQQLEECFLCFCWFQSMLLLTSTTLWWLGWRGNFNMCAERRDKEQLFRGT